MVYWLRKYQQEDCQVNNYLWALKAMTQHHLLTTTAAHTRASSGLSTLPITLHIEALSVGYSHTDKE